MYPNPDSLIEYRLSCVYMWLSFVMWLRQHSAVTSTDAPRARLLGSLCIALLSTSSHPKPTSIFRVHI